MSSTAVDGRTAFRQFRQTSTRAEEVPALKDMSPFFGEGGYTDSFFSPPI